MWRQWTGEKKMSAENISHVYRELTRGPLNWATGDLNQPGREQSLRYSWKSHVNQIISLAEELLKGRVGEHLRNAASAA